VFILTGVFGFALTGVFGFALTGVFGFALTGVFGFALTGVFDMVAGNVKRPPVAFLLLERVLVLGVCTIVFPPVACSRLNISTITRYFNP